MRASGAAYHGEISSRHYFDGMHRRASPLKIKRGMADARGARCHIDGFADAQQVPY